MLPTMSLGDHPASHGTDRCSLSQKAVNKEITEADLQEAFLKKGHSECSILDTDSHKLCWVSADITKFDPMLATMLGGIWRQDSKAYLQIRSTLEIRHA